MDFGAIDLYNTRSKELIRISTDIGIKHIQSNYQYTIYGDNDYSNIWVSGKNDGGQCGINDRRIKQLISNNFFKTNQIKIRKVCKNSGGSSTFWITSKNVVYGNGNNGYGQLGIIQDINRLFEPILISQLNNVIDVASAANYSIALCATDSDQDIMIINYWSRYYKLPTDITNLIILFNTTNKTYSTRYTYHGGNGLNRKESVNKWYEIDIFKNKNIIQIGTGYRHSVFLESNGSVWSCGHGMFCFVDIHCIFYIYI